MFSLSFIFRSIIIIIINIIRWRRRNTLLRVFHTSVAGINTLVTEPRAPITVGMTVTFMFYNFFNSRARSWYLSSFSFSFNFTQWSARTAKSTILQVLIFLLIIIWFGRLVEVRWSVCISKPRGVCASHFPGQILDCAYTIWFFGQTSIFCKIPSGSPCPFSFSHQR